MHGAIKIFYPLAKVLTYLGGRTSKHKSFSAQVQAVVKNSREQALQRHHRCIEREHLLMSMLEQRPGRIHEILNALGGDIAHLQQKTAEALAAYPRLKPNIYF